MAITAKITNMVSDERSKIRAFASVNVDEQFTIYGIKVVEGQTDTFVSMPSFQTKDDNDNPRYVDIFRIHSRDMREAISSAVLGAYEIALQQKENEQFENVFQQ